MRALVAAISLTLVTGCATYEANVNAREAGRLASIYSFSVLHIGCGGVGAPVVRGDHWEVPVLAGIAVNPQHPQGWIHVEKSNGVISYTYEGKEYPTLTPGELRRRQ